MGTIVWLEFGLSIPRVTTPYGSFSTPRNGGDKNYVGCRSNLKARILILTPFSSSAQLEYIYSSTAYRPKTWLLSTFLYGTMFITLGNMAGNAVSFSASLLRAAGAEDPGPSMTRLLAIGGVVLCFFLNVLSRRAGIWLNNVFALVKVLVLTVIILIGITIGVTGPRRANAESTDPSRLHTIDANIDTTVGSSTTSVGFTTALFSIGKCLPIQLILDTGVNGFVVANVPGSVPSFRFLRIRRSQFRKSSRIQFGNLSSGRSPSISYLGTKRG